MAPIPFNYSSIPECVKDRFFGYTKASANSCLEWIGHNDSRFGYGKFRWQNRMHYSHRFAWAIEHGGIPRGMRILHSCDNPKCVNIRHLFVGTMQDNVTDMRAKNRAVACPGSSNGNSKLSAKEVKAIRFLSSKMSQRALAKKFNVCQANIFYILKGETWAHLKP